MAGSKKTQSTDDEQVEAADAPAQSAAPQDEGQNDDPRPWRVEPFSDGEKWGWRLAAANGNVLRESGTDHDDATAALDAAREADLGDGIVYQDASTRPDRGW